MVIHVYLSMCALACLSPSRAFSVLFWWEWQHTALVAGARQRQALLYLPSPCTTHTCCPSLSECRGRCRSPAASALLPLCGCLPVVLADYCECHHLVRHVDIIIFS